MWKATFIHKVLGIYIYREKNLQLIHLYIESSSRISSRSHFNISEIKFYIPGFHKTGACTFLCRIEFEQLYPQRACGQECIEIGKWLYTGEGNSSKKQVHSFFGPSLCCESIQ